MQRTQLVPSIAVAAAAAAALLVCAPGCNPSSQGPPMPNIKLDGPPPKPWNPYSGLLRYKYIAAIDTDENGTITQEEMEAAPENLRKLDVNSDGQLDAAEFLMEEDLSQSSVRNFKSYKALDADQNDILDADEIAAATEKLKQLDANGDGSLAPMEYATASGGMGATIGPDGQVRGGGGGGRGGGRNMPSPEEFIQQNDKDGDGKVGKDELTGPAANFFDRMDEDQDGFITLEEVKAARERRRQREEGGADAGATEGDAAKEGEEKPTEPAKEDGAS